jgi:SWIM zinc finger
VLALAPDVPSQRAAQKLASPGSWPLTGALAAADASGGPAADAGSGGGEAHAALWGECRGSAAVPYRTAVDLSGPAYQCSCPSRKFPCKHALALLLLSADGAVAAGGDPPDWATTWLAARAAKARRAAGDPAGDITAEPDAAPAGTANPEAARRRAEQREQRVASGVAELDRWLCDQVRQGLAASQQAGYRHWDDIAARMVDAQAPGLAERLRALAAVPYSGAGWDGRLLAEYAQLRLLTIAYRRQAKLPPPLRDTVRSRIGFTVRQADVLASGQPVKDRWSVLARRDLEQERLRSRRVWLRGRETGRYALVLSFAPAGMSLDDSLAVGAGVDAELVFYPAAVPLRALVGTRHGEVPEGAPPGSTVAELLAGWAAALAEDPWLDSWPAVLTVTPARAPRPCLYDAAGHALPLHPGAGPCWSLFAVSGGTPLTVAGEWTPHGLWPLTAWDDGGRAVPL